MIHTQQMQHAMEHQDAKLVPHPMPEIAGLRTRVIERDGDVAQTPAHLTGKRQHIRSLILPAKTPVQPPQLRIIRKQASESASSRNPALERNVKVRKLRPPSHAFACADDQTRRFYGRGHGLGGGACAARFGFVPFEWQLAILRFVVALISTNDFLHQRMAHHIALVEMHEANLGDPAEHFERIP